MNFFKEIIRCSAIAGLLFFFLYAALSIAQTTIKGSGNPGTVTSVGLSLPSFISVSGSPVTGSGTLTGTLVTQNANLVFAGPSSGGSGSPTFRSLVSADLPATSVSWSSLTAPTASNAVSATVDTQQALYGRFDGSATTNPYLFQLGETSASSKPNARIFMSTTLSGSTAFPFVFGAQGGGMTNWMGAIGDWNFSGNADLFTNMGGAPFSAVGGATASANSAGNVTLGGGNSTSTGSGGNVIINGGNNSSSGNGGNITLTAGTSSSGTAGFVQLVGPWSHTSAEADLAYTYNTPATGTTVTLATGTETAIIDPSGTLSTLTITLPGCTSAYDGKIARYGTSQILTALTVNSTSGSVKNAPTSAAAGSGHGFLCRGALTTWYTLY